MPIYEYKCVKCGKVFEAYKRITEEKQHENCPFCGEKANKLGISLFSARTGRGSGSCGPSGSPFG